MPNFDDVLNTKAEDVVKLPPKPTGTYVASVTKFPESRNLTTKDNEEKTILTYHLKLMTPQDDVSQDALADQPEVSSWAPMKYDIWLDDLNQLKRFLVDVLGIDEVGRTFKEMIADSPGCQCLATIEHKPFTNKAGEPDIAANITRVAKL